MGKARDLAELHCLGPNRCEWGNINKMNKHFHSQFNSLMFIAHEGNAHFCDKETLNLVVIS